MPGLAFLLGAWIWLLFGLAAGQLERAGDRTALPSAGSDPVFFGPQARYVVSVEAAGARCAVPADLDDDGDMDIVVVSSNDNTVAWYERLADGSYGAKQMISRASNGARIVTVGDMDNDNRTDVIVASYYDHTVGWFRNMGGGKFGAKQVISQTATAAQGVYAADLDNDGDLDVLAASSGDDTVAWYENLGGGRFCEVKRVIDQNSVGVRTVIAVDLNEDGFLDLAVASKDDNSITWYRNDQHLNFQKIVIDNTARGAYSLVAKDVDQDGHIDLVTAANMEGFIEANGEGGRVSVYHNDKFKNGELCNFTKIPVTAGNDTGTNDFDWFVLSVWAGDLDLDGDIDIASASFGLLHQGGFSWYENVDGSGKKWLRHKIYVTPGVRTGHYIVGADLDGDGDTDLVATSNGDNKVQVLFSHTRCDNSASSPSRECCSKDYYWTGSACETCPMGKFIDNQQGAPTCAACSAACPRPGLNFLPRGCHSMPSCENHASAYAGCDCGVNKFLNNIDVCEECPDGQITRGDRTRTPGDYFLVERKFVDQTTYKLSDKSWYGFNFSRCQIPECSPGSYFNMTTRKCQACLAGFFSPGGSVTDCEVCPAGSACTEGTQVPRPCQAGNYSAAGSSVCSVSPPGYITSIAGMAHPIPCSPGYVSAAAGGVACFACEVGTFAPDYGLSSCNNCGDNRESPLLWTTMRQIERYGERLWVYTEAATGNATKREGICTCDVKARLSSTGECVPCEEGLSCPGGPDPPTMLRGYHANTRAHFPVEAFAGVDGDYSVFRCMSESWCPGGAIGTCNAGRFGPGCSACEPGLTAVEDGACAPCRGQDQFVLVVVILGGLCSLAGLFWLVDRDKQTTPSLSAVLILITCSLIASALQQIGVFGSLSIEWVSPLSDIISLGSVLNFSVDALRFGCVMTLDPLPSYLVSIAPIAGIGSITILFHAISVLIRYHGKFRERTPALISTLGTIVLIFLIANVHIVVAPFHCIEMPNKLKVTKKFPSVICGETSDHTAMLTVGLVNSVLPLSFAATVVWVVRQFPRRMRDGDARFLRSFSFMVYRFKPEYVWYICLFTFRSLMIPIVPILPNVTVQVILMVTLLSIMGWVQARCFPWRLEVANYMDSFMALMLIVFLTCLGFLKPPETDNNENVKTVSYVGATVLIAFLSASLLALLGGIVWHVYRRNRKDFQFFICHHKADASAQARLMKILLAERSGSKVFIDSDDLKNLDTLLDTVRCKVEHLVVYLTKETLTRPWCAGEVTTAVSSGVKITMIITQSWVPLEPLQLENIAAYLDLSNTNLMQYGISFDMVSEAYTTLFSGKYPSVALQSDVKGAGKFDSVVGTILAKTHISPEVDYQEGGVLVSSSPDEDESTASALILLRKMIADLMGLCPQGASMLASRNSKWPQCEICDLVRESFGLVVILGKGSMDSLEQLEAIVYGMTYLERVVPLILPSFSFPNPSYYVQQLPRVWRGDLDLAELALKEFFCRIGINFSIHGSDEILGTQAKSVVERLGQVVRPADSAKRMPSLSPRGMESPAAPSTPRLISLTRSDQFSGNSPASLQTTPVRSLNKEEQEMEYEPSGKEYPPYSPDLKHCSVISEEL